MITVFMHGAGRAGAEAWPVQAVLKRDDWVFMTRARSGDEPYQDAQRLLEHLPEDGGQVAAASYGALAALFAATLRPSAVSRLVLFEPACFSLARGLAPVEAHISAMTPVFDLAHDSTTTDEEFARLFADGMDTPIPDLPPEQLRERIARLRATRPPWTVKLSSDAVAARPTVVVTGGWSDLYEHVAAALVDLGAEHRILEGFGHRPQDHYGANTILECT